jgi:hypothetical protein
MKFQIGDRAVVTGDSAREGHSFAPGTVVILRDVGGSGAIWQCHGDDDWWWVNAADLKLLDPGPTDQEILAAFGLAAKPTDADYLRRLSVDPRVPLTVQDEITTYLNEV